MASQTPHTVRWGIMATGWIAESTLPHALPHPHRPNYTPSSPKPPD